MSQYQIRLLLNNRKFDRLNFLPEMATSIIGK